MISVEHLTKCYGEFEAVHDLTFTIEEGHVYGFLGPNGAGKSTTMNMMTGCLSPTSGTVRIGGYDIFEDAYHAKKLIGYLPEQPPLYVNESPDEYLHFVGSAKGLREPELSSQVNRVCFQTKLETVRHKRMSMLSKGYRQRVGIAQALLGEPDVIILDEPTVGLDPLQIIEIRDLIKELGSDHTVILSSHILSEVQNICDQVLIIAGGKLIAFDAPDQLESKLLSPNEITFTADTDAKVVREILARENLTAHRMTEDNDSGVTTASLSVGKKDLYQVSRQLFFAFAAADIALLEIELKRANLEDIFIELTEAGSKNIGLDESEKLQVDEGEVGE